MPNQLPKALWVILHVGFILGCAQPGCGWGVRFEIMGSLPVLTLQTLVLITPAIQATPRGSKEGVKQPREIHRKWGLRLGEGAGTPG